MKKKGEEFSLWFFPELIVAVFVAYLAINVATSYAKGTAYEKLNIAKDIAMQINAIQSVPGDAYIINDNLHDYSVYFNDNRVEVYEEGLDQTKKAYYFTKPSDFKIDHRMVKPKQIVISKINNEIKIFGEIPG